MDKVETSLEGQCSNEESLFVTGDKSKTPVDGGSRDEANPLLIADGNGTSKFSQQLPS